MTLYLWIKTFHLLFVIAWMASVFYLPRILVNIAEAGSADAAVRARLLLMGRRLYKFGHNMFGLAIVLGAILWLGYRFIPDFPTMVGGGKWLHAKLGLVVLILAHYIVAGRWLKGVDKGRALPSSRALRVFNELPVLLLLGVIWLVLAKPF